jgi:hypothetical protein
MTKTSAIEDILEYSDYSQVAYRRIGFGMETWDITGPNEDDPVNIRIQDEDGTITVNLFTGPGLVDCGEIRFSGQLAAPAFVASAIDQIAADYLL